MVLPAFLASCPTLRAAVPTSWPTALALRSNVEEIIAAIHRDWGEAQHGHSVQTMLSTYTAWTEGAKDEDIEVIRAAMGSCPMPVAKESEIPLKSPLGSTKTGTQFGTNLSQQPR